VQFKKIMSDFLRFFVKRVLILYGVSLIICLLCKSERIAMVMVLTGGVLFSVLKFALLEAVLKLLGSGRKKTLAIMAIIIIYLFSLVIIGVLVVFAMRIGVYTFIAAMVGSLSVIIIVMINAITEALGITKNQYGQKVK
jgi:hypothetical protein